MTRQFILASASPRRKEILQELGLTFAVEPSRFEEIAAGLSARETALAFARGKAREVFARFPEAVVLGADTVVSLGDAILGKPHSEEEAEEMLRLLSGKTHSVFTGLCMLGAEAERESVVETRVTFYDLDEKLIKRYVKSGLPMDKAGAYGIQDGYPLVRAVEGSYTNVVGLPAEEVSAFLQAFGGELC